MQGKRTNGMTRLLRQVLADRRGATAIEYGLIVSLIVIAMIGSFQQVANVTTVMWNNVSSEVVRASQ